MQDHAASSLDEVKQAHYESKPSPLRLSPLTSDVHPLLHSPPPTHPRPWCWSLISWFQKLGILFSYQSEEQDRDIGPESHKPNRARSFPEEKQKDN